jgi:regulator of extracellular matrix RemA (YlzA/DUF370 family)
MNVFSLWDIHAKYSRKARNVIISRKNQMIQIGPDDLRGFFVVDDESIGI